MGVGRFFICIFREYRVCLLEYCKVRKLEEFGNFLGNKLLRLMYFFGDC